MRLRDLVLNNLWRRRGRMALLVLGLAIGAATVVTLVAISEALQADIVDKLDQFGANLVIVPRSQDLSLSYGGVTVASTAYDVADLTQADLELLRTIPDARNVSVVAPKLLSTLNLDEGRGQILVAGVVFTAETRLKPWWQVTGMTPTEPDEALLGARVAETYGLGPGSPLIINNQPLKVTGILQPSGSSDDEVIYLNLATAQWLANRPGKVNLVEVAALCTGCPIEDMVAQIGTVLPQARVTALSQAAALRGRTAEQLGRFGLAVSLVVAVIGALVVLTTMLGAVAERRQEIGLFRALGFRQRHIVQVILGEAALTSLAGGALGWLAGMAAALVLAPRVAGVAVAVPWDPRLALATLGGALAIGLLAGLYPARQASRLDPTIALRSL